MWAYDEDTNTTALQPVVDIMQNETDHTISLYTETEVIETTALHPFYTQDGWKDASELQTGDQIKTQSHENVEIKNTKFNYEPQKVYNFTVGNFHTYFVGALAWLVHNAGKCITTAIKKISNRLKYLGKTPGKASKTGKEVFERMMKDGTARITKTGKKLFKDSDGVWRDIQDADMGHINDAVGWWNKTGRKYGAKSKEVRDWMKNSNNYVLEYFKTNRSNGAKLGETYLPPLK